jgi:hypothetical protein
MMVVMGAWTRAVGGENVRGDGRVCCDFATCALTVTDATTGVYCSANADDDDARDVE